MSEESFQEKVLGELNAIKSDVALLKLDYAHRRRHDFIRLCAHHRRRHSRNLENRRRRLETF